MHRFYINQTISGKTFTCENEEIIHQLKDVLRFHAGENIILFDNKQKEFQAQIETINKKQITFQIMKEFKNISEAKNKIHLYQSLVKRDNFELILQKGTEIGADSFTPVLAQRSEKKSIKIERCEKILKEATEQSGRVIIPKLNKIMDLKQALASAPKPIIAFDFSGKPFSKNTITEKASIFIGPEGGWTPEELAMFKNSQATIYTLGPRVLRAETAAIAALTLALL
ncbi:MAG: RsmE family RNA methyltransferase [Patescibacteria group bacterium]|jgi:16S rRNA (uracil1498-N3)-methyltransferase